MTPCHPRTGTITSNNLCELCEEVTANRSAVRSLRAASEEIEVALRSVERFASLAGTDSTGE